MRGVVSKDPYYDLFTAMLHAPIPDVKREVLAMVKLVQAYPLFEQVFQAGV